MSREWEKYLGPNARSWERPSFFRRVAYRLKHGFYGALIAVSSLFVLISIPANAEVTISVPFAFADRFPGNSQHLGWEKGNLLALGATVFSNEFQITTVTATNLTSGLVLDLTPQDIGPLFSGLYQVVPLPSFNPNEHLGIWEIYAEDEYGNSATAETHNLDKEGIMPYVKGITAFGNPYTPTITWREPKEKFIPEGCVLYHRLRLLTSGYDQFYRSPLIAGTLSHTIPEGVLNEENFYDTWVRIEFQCLDLADIIDPDRSPIELRSETFRPLSDLLLEGATP